MVLLPNSADAAKSNRAFPKLWRNSHKTANSLAQFPARADISAFRAIRLLTRYRLLLPRSYDQLQASRERASDSRTSFLSTRALMKLHDVYSSSRLFGPVPTLRSLPQLQPLHRLRCRANVWLRPRRQSMLRGLGQRRDDRRQRFRRARCRSLGRNYRTYFTLPSRPRLLFKCFRCFLRRFRHCRHE